MHIYAVFTVTRVIRELSFFPALFVALFKFVSVAVASAADSFQ